MNPNAIADKTRRGNELWSMGSLQVILWNDTYVGNQVFVDKKSKIVIRNIIPLICKCGPPMGGRIRIDKGLNHYYCPHPERRFNNNYKMDVHCDMKRGINIPTTDSVLWNIR